MTSPVCKYTPFISLIVALMVSYAIATEVRFCVESKPANAKCNEMAKHVKDITLTCVLDEPCDEKIATDVADVAVVDADKHTSVLKSLQPVLYESFADDNVIVGVVSAADSDKIETLPLGFNAADLRETHAALYINHYRHGGVCSQVKPAKNVQTIELMRYHDLKDKTDKKLVCVANDKLVTKSVDDYKTCHVEANIANTVMVKKDSPLKNDVVKMLQALVDDNASGFKLFGGVFEGKSNLIFSDEAKSFVTEHVAPNGVTIEKFLALHCGNVGAYHDHN